MKRLPPAFAGGMPFIASGCEPERVTSAREFFTDAQDRRNGTPARARRGAGQRVRGIEGERDGRGVGVPRRAESYADAMTRSTSCMANQSISAAVRAFVAISHRKEAKRAPRRTAVRHLRLDVIAAQTRCQQCIEAFVIAGEKLVQLSSHRSQEWMSVGAGRPACAAREFE